MKFRILTFIIAVFSAAFVAGAADTADGLLSKAAERLRSAKSVTAQFTLSSGGSKSSGKIILAGDRFHVSTQELSTWYDGKTQWTYSPQAGEVNITEPTPEELQQVNPFAIINAFRRGYKATLAGKTANTRTVLLRSSAKNADITTVTLTLNASTHYPTRIVLNMADGTRLSIDVTKVTAGGTLPASTFTFDKRRYPSATVVDLR